MSIDHKAAALEEFLSERADLAGHVEKLERERQGLRARLAELDNEISPLAVRLHQLDSVIAPLASLVESRASGELRTGTPTEALLQVAEGERALVDDDNEAWEIPDVFKRYMPKSGDGKRKRLRSTLMVSDVVDKLGEPVTRDRLREAFYEHFGREDIERFWHRPDNALGTAIIRARDEDLIIEIPGIDGGPPLYTGHFRNSETGEPAFPALHIEEAG